MATSQKPSEEPTAKPAEQPEPQVQEGRFAENILSFRKKTGQAGPQGPQEPIHYKDKQYVLRCGECQGVGIVFKAGWHPNMGAITDDKWDAAYKEGGFKGGWRRPSLFCQECLDRGNVVALRALYDESVNGFRLIRRHIRFIEEIDPKSARFMKHVQTEEKARMEAALALKAAESAGIDMAALGRAITHG